MWLCPGFGNKVELRRSPERGHCNTEDGSERKGIFAKETDVHIVVQGVRIGTEKNCRTKS